jgi:hypothetical protein
MPWKSREVFGKKRMPRRIKRRSPDRAIPTLAELQTKLESVRREVRNLTIMAMDPNQTSEQAALVRQLERSARAETRLRSMALAHSKSKLPS